MSTVSTPGEGSGTKISMEKIKRTVMQSATAAPVKGKLMTVKLKPAQITGFKSSEMKVIKKD